MRIGRQLLYAAVVFAGWGTAQAADPNYSCSISDEDQKRMGCVCTAEINKPTALLDQIKGEVLKSDEKGFTLVSEPTPLNVGDGVLVMDKGNALLVMGRNCTRQLGPNASLEIRRTERGCACAALLEDHPKSVGVPPLLPIAIAAGAAGAVAGLVQPSSP